MIFITVGSQKFQFNRLLKEMDELSQKKKIEDCVFAQLGYSDYIPKNYDYVNFLDRNNFIEKIEQCDILITHGGTGAIMSGLKAGKKVIAIARLSDYGEHVDDHQLQILEEFGKLDLLKVCDNISELGEIIQEIRETEFSKYKSHNREICESIINFIEGSKMLVVSNMYPDKKNPSYGIFVKSFCEELKKLNICFDCSVMKKSNNKFNKLVGYLLFYFKTLFKILLNKYDVVYIHYASYSAIPVLIASKFKKINIYTNLHGSDLIPENKTQAIMTHFTLKILKISNKIIVPSEYFSKLVLEKNKNLANKIAIYPSCGVDTSKFKVCTETDKLEVCKKHAIDSSKITFGYIGRITSNKGWDTYLEAAKRVLDNGNDVQFILVGNGFEDEKLEKMIENFDFKTNIVRLPLLAQEDLVKMYNVIDYFVFPTKRVGESLGLVAFEAIACGCVLLASDFAAPKYYINDNVNGFKFKVGDASDLSKLMERMINLTTNEIARIRENAGKTLQEYDRKNIREKLLEILK